MSTKLTTMQAAYLTRAMTTGGGLIELGELARGLGKQKGHVVKKLESNFNADALSKMESGYIQQGGKGASRTVKTYMLDYKTAGALAMSYDLQLGVEVLTLLEEAVQTIGVMTKAVQAGDTQAALEASLSFSERMRNRLEYTSGQTENETCSVALKRLGRKGVSA
ncbi:hypothetical protein [Photorhabdus luminescens]|uniref:Uncharacterized protein n=1 Tax=Photorhabdus luminescens subsp. sonorensis TaxID=1173677 RepID=A0A5C4REM1_PHOLU|nr:hypothetical protein [Photorhabdus luminescens]TNH42274.1 hypothetical protein EP164_17880 [Photorhabdus luminescens subsp. sonorensis]